MQRLTPVAPVKPLPVIVTVAPTRPENGEKPVIVGPFDTVNSASETPVPDGVVTRQRPSHDPPGTTADTSVADTTVKNVGVMHRLTPVAPVKFVPVIVTDAPTGPAESDTAEIVGGLETVKIASPTPVPAAVVTRQRPSHDPPGTT